MGGKLLNMAIKNSPDLKQYRVIYGNRTYTINRIRAYQGIVYYNLFGHANNRLINCCDCEVVQDD